MVPKAPTKAPTKARFPRASGDGPTSMPEARENAAFPPRERGWSFVSDLDAGVLEVSPARAGMVPVPGWCDRSGPGFPRASGDGPGFGLSDWLIRRFPPRERGWSPGIPRRPRKADVSPARAGMVPGVPFSFERDLSFPRASGDGPVLMIVCSRVVKFPPRERGWSPLASWE